MLNTGKQTFHTEIQPDTSLVFSIRAVGQYLPASQVCCLIYEKLTPTNWLVNKIYEMCILKYIEIPVMGL